MRLDAEFPPYGYMDENGEYKEARELLEKVGIGDKENSYPCELSGGQQQRKVGKLKYACIFL